MYYNYGISQEGTGSSFKARGSVPIMLWASLDGSKKRTDSFVREQPVDGMNSGETLC